MSYECVRLIVLVVAVQWDRIHKLRKFFQQKIFFRSFEPTNVHVGRNTKLKQNAPFGLAKYFLTMEQLSLDTVHEMNLIELK